MCTFNVSRLTLGLHSPFSVFSELLRIQQEAVSLVPLSLRLCCDLESTQIHCVTKQMSNLESADFLTVPAFIVLCFYLHYTSETTHHYLN